MAQMMDAQSQEFLGFSRRPLWLVAMDVRAFVAQGDELHGYGQLTFKERPKGPPIAGTDDGAGQIVFTDEALYQLDPVRQTAERYGLGG